jgi:hypothetical protein
MPAAELEAQLRGNAAALRRLQIIDKAIVLRPLRAAMAGQGAHAF